MKSYYEDRTRLPLCRGETSFDLLVFHAANLTSIGGFFMQRALLVLLLMVGLVVGGIQVVAAASDQFVALDPGWRTDHH